MQIVVNKGEKILSATVSNGAPVQGARIPVSRMVESVVGCKWSLEVIALLRRGVNRPGAMVRAIDGLTTKVLNERLNKMLRFGILERIAYPEIPPRVEYRFTDFGERFVAILDSVNELQRYLDGEPGLSPPAAETPARITNSLGE